MSLSFTVTVTRCGECPHGGLFARGCKKASAYKSEETLVANHQALTDTGPYACPMLKQVEQDDDEPDCPIHGKTDGGDCPRC